MRKHRWLPIVLAAVVIAACYGGIELSQFILDDYRDEVEEITEERDQDTFYLDYREHDVLWPWNLYEEDFAEPVTDPEKQGLASSVTEVMLDAFSGIRLSGPCTAGASLERIPAQTAHGSVPDETGAEAAAGGENSGTGDAEYDSYSHAENVFSGDIYFVHDYKFRSADGRECIVNIAYADGAILYYSCVSKEDRDSSFEDINGACEFLNYQYTEMREGWYTGYDREYQNCFFAYEQRLESAVSLLEEMFPLNWNVLAIHQGLIESGSSSGVSSDGSILNLEFYGEYDRTYRLALFFSPSENSFVGFSLREG